MVVSFAVVASAVAKSDAILRAEGEEFFHPCFLLI